MSLKLSLAAAALLAATSFSAQAAEAPAQVAVAAPAQVAAPAPVRGQGNPDCPYYDEHCARVNGAVAPGPRMDGSGPRAGMRIDAVGPRMDGTGPHHRMMAGEVAPAPRAMRADAPRPAAGPQPLRGPKNFSVDEINNHKRRMLNEICPQHHQPLKNCLGPEIDQAVGADFKKLQDLQDQLFVKDQVLKAQVNAGEDAATITKYANDVNKARRDYRAFVHEVKAKVHKMAADHKAGAQAAPAAKK